MSSQNVIENVNAIENVAPDAEKQKKPTLAGKYSKLLNFGFWFSSMLESEELKTQLYNQLRLFGSIEEQTELFERFLAEEKEVAKTVRKCIAEHNKPPKPVKEKATKAPRKGKAVVHQDELISQLIADANADPIADKPDETAARLAKEEADRLVKEAKEAEKEAAKLAKEEANRLAKEAKEAEKEVAKLAKEEVDRLAKEAKELKEAEKVVAKLEKEAAAALAKKAKAAEKQAKEDAATLAKEAKEQEKANKAKPAKKTSKAKSVPIVNEVIEKANETVPIVNEVIEKANETVPIVNEVIEKATETIPIAPIIEDELVAEVIEDQPIANANPQPIVVDELVAEVIEDQPIANPQPNVPKADNATKTTKKSKVAKEPKAAKESKATKEPKAAKEPKSKSEKKTKKADKPVEPVAEEGEEVQVNVYKIGDKEYLKDEENNIFDIETHAHIGIYNPDTCELEYL